MGDIVINVKCGPYLLGSLVRLCGQGLDLWRIDKIWRVGPRGAAFEVIQVNSRERRTVPYRAVELFRS
jgi:hypothetical protein